MGFMIGGVSARDLVLDGHSVSLYAGGSPPVKVWPTGETRETVRIILSPSTGARNQLRDALSALGMDYRTVTELPFDIELVGTGWTQHMFDGCSSLTHVPDLATGQVTNMSYMFRSCSSLTHVPDLATGQVTNMSGMLRSCSSLTTVPDMDTSQVTDMSNMLRDCSALTDGNVRLLGKHPNVTTTNMILGSGLTREPFYDTNGNPI